MKRNLACGLWPSQLAPESVATGAIRLGDLCVDGEDLYWTESRADQQGRMTLLRRRSDDAIEEITPPPFSVRSRVHEYGGGAFAARKGVIVFCNDSDQRLYWAEAAAPTPKPLTAAGPLRYADLQFDLRHQRLVCVVESARPAQEPENVIAAVDLATGAVSTLVSGGDFYAFPRVDGHGKRLAYLTWNHPHMPWDACELRLAKILDDGSLAPSMTIAGGESEAIFQPAWSPAGELFFISDRGGFSNLYRWTVDQTAECVHEKTADFSTPLWVFGLSTYAWMGDDLICAYQASGLWRLGVISGADGHLETVDTDLTEIGHVLAHREHAFFLAGSAGQAMGIHGFDPSTREVSTIHCLSKNPLPPEAVSRPKPVDFPTGEQAMAHGLFYPPRHPDHEPLAGERPPLLVVCHGGPTGSTSSALNLNIQFWTNRGFAVLDVNYRGSTGYGRDYRKSLDGQWGVVDVEDCVAGARFLAAQGLVDGRRMAIRGSSAGGFTVLCALAFHDVFAAGASYYGVSDLEALAKDTHKFESRYLDSLIGPYPERRDLYQARSPIHAADRLSCPVIFFQGEEDRVVPPAQAEAMVAALRKRGMAAPLILFPGEQHGFRREETICRALFAELDFYRQAFGIKDA